MSPQADQSKEQRYRQLRLYIHAEKERGVLRALWLRSGRTHFSLAKTTSWCHGSRFLSSSASSTLSALVSFSLLCRAALTLSRSLSFARSLSPLPAMACRRRRALRAEDWTASVALRRCDSPKAWTETRAAYLLVRAPC